MATRVVQANQTADPAAETYDWVVPIEPPLSLEAGNTVTLLSAAVQKSGADLQQSPNVIVLDEDFHAVVLAGVQFVNSGDPNRAAGLDKFNGADESDYLVYTVTHSASNSAQVITIPLTVPAGTYQPAEVAAILNELTRAPATAEPPIGTVTGPCVQDMNAGKLYSTAPLTGGPSVENKFTITGITLPPDPTVAATFAAGKQVQVVITDPASTTDTVIDVGIDASGTITVDDLIGYNDGAIAHIRSDHDTDFQLRLDPANGADPLYEPAATNPMSVFGSTVGLSFTWDETRGRFLLTTHSPLQDANQNVVVSIAPDTGGNPRSNGVGKRGRLALFKGSWGVSESEWQTTLWHKMGFAYSDLNGTTDQTDVSGWISSDGLLDTTYDAQLNTGAPTPFNVLSQKVSGPVGAVLSTRYEGTTTPGWLIECSLLPSAKWHGADGRNLSRILGVVSRQFSSLDYYHQSGGPTWAVELPKGESFMAGSVRIRLLRSDTAVPDTSIGPGSEVIVLLTQ
jgi:hypothetical protein